MNKGIGKTSRDRLSKVLRAAKGTISPPLVSSTLNIGRQEAGRILARWCSAGWLRRVRRGFYVAVPVEASSNQIAIEHPGLVVSKIFDPGYIGGFSAVKHWDFSEQIFETIVFFTTKKVKDRNPVCSGIKVHLKLVNADKMFGLKTIWEGSANFRISDPTKTIVDLLDEPSLGGGITPVREYLEAYLNSEHKNLGLLADYALRMKNRTIFKRLGFLLEILNVEEPDLLKKMQSNISTGYSLLDPSLKCSRIVKKWNLKIPQSWVSEYDRKK